MSNKDISIDYSIISKPDYIEFICPHCKELVTTDFDNVDYDDEYWGDGGWVDCPNCDSEVRLGSFDYS